MLFLLGGPYNVIFSIFYLLGDNKISTVYNCLKFQCYLYICLEIIFYSSYRIKVLYLSQIMFDRINSTPQFKAVELYISVEPCTEVSGEYVQQTILEGGGGVEL